MTYEPKPDLQALASHVEKLENTLALTAALALALAKLPPVPPPKKEERK